MSAAFALFVSACATGTLVPESQPPKYEPVGETKCAVTQSHSSPLIVEWPSTERAKLESLARSGVVPVRYTDCHMKTLASCRVKSSYKYVALTPKHDTLRVRNESELYASMPVYAASFEGKLKRAGELTVAMTIVGRFEADRATFSTSDLDGDCAEATHVIAGVTSGAFQFAAGAAADTEGGAALLGARAGGKVESSRETLAQDGEEKACSASTEGASAPPFGCGAFLRLEMAPISKAKASGGPGAGEIAAVAAVVAVAAVGAVKEATAGNPTAANKPTVDTSCPGGTRFVKDRGCVAELAPSSRYTLSATSVVDTTTKLTWMRMPETSGVAWADAKALCAGLTIDGGGFRLPKKEELLGLGENLPEGIDRRAFPTASSHEKHLAAMVFYWTATPHAVSETMAWAVRFGSMGAQSTVQSRTSRNSVRCVK